MKTVQVTGNFDNWAKGNAPLAKESGTFRDQIRVDKKQKLVFKFVVNGTEWVTSESYKKELDDNGIENNYIDADELVEVEKFEQDAGETKGGSGGVIGAAGSLGKNRGVSGERGEDIVKEKGEIEHNKDNGDSLTATSSFAAISTTDSTSDSKYEHIDDAYESPQRYRGNVENETRPGMDDAVDDDDDHSNGNQFNTPTNSVFNSEILPAPVDRKYKDPVSSTADTSVSNMDPSSPRVSTGAKQTLSQLNGPAKDKLTSHKDEMVEILKVPGSFPSPASSETDSNVNYFDSKPPVKRETLISRFKSLFKP